MLQQPEQHAWNNLTRLIGFWVIAGLLVALALAVNGRVNAQGGVVQLEEPRAAANGNAQYLPFIPNRFPPIPFAPVLNRIDGAYDGTYTVSWTDTDTIFDYYILEQYYNETFAAPNVVYQGPAKSIELARPVLGYYYYRVKAVNEFNGVVYESPYSNIRVAAAIGIGVDRNQIDLDETNPCTTLRWRYTNVREVHVTTAKGIDSTGVVGISEATICPSVTTTYTARVVYPNNGVVIWNVTVNVTGSGCNRDPYVNRFQASRNPVDRNQPFDISWDVQCAREVYFVRGTLETPTVGIGEMKNVTITADTTFQLKIKRQDNTFVYTSLLVKIR